MPNIGIVGGGVSALHLGLTLVTEGVAATIYAPETAAQIANGRMQNTVAHMPDTIARERALGVDFWDERSVRTCRVRHYSLRVGQGQAVDFHGELGGDERCIDYRLYLPRLMAEFERRGGQLEHRLVGPDDVDDLYSRHSLLAIASGKKDIGFTDFFPLVEELSLHDAPPRQLCVGLYDGVRDRDPLGVTVGISPGHGEIVVLPMETADGPLMALLFENRPDGDLADLPALDYRADPAVFEARILEALRDHYPTVHAHVDLDAFGLHGDQNLLQGGFRPVTRESWTEVSDGRYAIAIGDLRCTQDPLTGQGANLASRGACALGAHILESDGVFDRAFCEAYEQKMRYIVAGTVGFNNALLDPAPHTQAFLGMMAGSPALCTDFSSRFAAPHTIWFDILKDAETCDAYLTRDNDAVASN
ncbi:MAG: styrene monooxygenase/indole monooxygenase family protein [Gammaproteobacteria bacterium]